MSETNRLQIPSESFLREQKLTRLLMSFLIVGLFFMLIPGVFLGVWNLIDIGHQHSAAAPPSGWIQAHGHAMLFGWIATFILGIGFYSLPNVRNIADRSFTHGWIILCLWSVGAFIRWTVCICSWQWRLLLPVSAVLELCAVIIFFWCSAAGHKNKAGKKLEAAVLLVVAGTFGQLLTLFLNLVQSIALAIYGMSPLLPKTDGKLLLAMFIWAFIVPVAWGLSAKWMPIFLGLERSSNRLLYWALCVDLFALVAAFANFWVLATCGFVLSVVLFVIALKLFQSTVSPPKVSGVHFTFPFFVRLSYVWLVIASLLGVWAALDPQALGVLGASRHAITVGFISTLVFSIGPRVLPSFLGRQAIYSTKIMLLSLLAINVGCILRVATEILAYQDYALWAWNWLPVSALIELTGMCLFVWNMLLTFIQRPLSSRLTIKSLDQN